MTTQCPKKVSYFVGLWPSKVRHFFWDTVYVHHSLTLRLIECALYNVLLEHGELPCVLPFDVHLDLGHLPDTQGYFGLLPEPCNPTQGF